MDEVADEILDLVARGARDLRSLPSGEGDGAGGKPVVVLNLAVLVDDADVDAFGRAVAEAAERFGEEGFTLVTSGPWPPYHFTGDPDAGEPAPDCGEGGVAR
jgi:hypothetical protein